MSDLRLFFAWCADQHLAPLALQRAQIKRYVRCMQEILEIISHFVWLYYCFPLSFREVQEMMLQRGVVVSHETIRQWCAKFGQTYANELRRRRARPGDKWHLDEMFIKINGKTHYLWQAVDQHGAVLNSRNESLTPPSRTSPAGKTRAGEPHKPAIRPTDGEPACTEPTVNGLGKVTASQARGAESP